MLALNFDNVEPDFKKDSTIYRLKKFDLCSQENEQVKIINENNINKLLILF